jgi:hypothetical protein
MFTKPAGFKIFDRIISRIFVFDATGAGKVFQSSIRRGRFVACISVGFNRIIFNPFTQ